MLNVMITAGRASMVMFALCGLIYPLALTVIGQLVLPFQANGSLERDPEGVVLGSCLIGQQWNGPEWFHGRPSATTGIDQNDPSRNVSAPYNAANSAGSNLGPTNRSLMARLLADRQALEAAQPELMGKLLPSDMLTASASGLDPDISPANAALQAARVANARGIPQVQIEGLLERYTVGRSLGVFGEPRINVLALNLALQRSNGSNETGCGL